MFFAVKVAVDGCGCGDGWFCDGGSLAAFVAVDAAVFALFAARAVVSSSPASLGGIAVDVAVVGVPSFSSCMII